MANSREPLNEVDCIEPSEMHPAVDADVGGRGTVWIAGVESANCLSRVVQILGRFPSAIIGAIADPTNEVF